MLLVLLCTGAVGEIEKILDIVEVPTGNFCCSLGDWKDFVIAFVQFALSNYVTANGQAVNAPTNLPSEEVQQTRKTKRLPKQFSMQ
jgi:hypothetical protein